MRVAGIFLAFLYSLIGLAQQPYQLIISGHVTEKDTSIHIKGAVLQFKADNGAMLETRSDSMGYYEFRFRSIGFHKGQVSVTTTAFTSSVNSNKHSYGYLPSPDTGALTISDTLHAYIKNFQLTGQVPGCYYPGILFFKNSTNVCGSYVPGSDNVASDTTNLAHSLELLKKILEDNPTIVMELSAHSSMDENDPVKLSMLRAAKIKEELVKRGIAPGRLVARGYGMSTPLIKPETIVKAGSAAEKEKMNARNRRCVFKVLSWDYKGK